MCKRVTCKICRKISWTGCAKHIPAVMQSVPQDEWCVCTDGRIEVTIDPNAVINPSQHSPSSSLRSLFHFGSRRRSSAESRVSSSSQSSSPRSSPPVQESCLKTFSFPPRR